MHEGFGVVVTDVIVVDVVVIADVVVVDVAVVDTVAVDVLFLLMLLLLLLLLMLLLFLEKSLKFALVTILHNTPMHCVFHHCFFLNDKRDSQHCVVK